MSDRYTTGLEGELQPGSGNKVLRNKFDIIDPSQMAAAELALLERLYDAVFLTDFPDRTLTVADLKNWHRRWLGNIYIWAGNERSVNMSKGHFQFATAAQIPHLLDTFEHDCLLPWTPCRLSGTALSHALAVTHIELILIHPFREGNGRLSRLLADVMAVQAGRKPLDYQIWEQNKDFYITAIHAGHAGDYSPMQKLMTQALGSQ